jgi:hypothetical protein
MSPEKQPAASSGNVSVQSAVYLPNTHALNIHSYKPFP